MPCRIKTHLEPLAIATNVAQAAHTRLDHVLLMLANLVRIYSDTRVEGPIRDVILGSIGRRWEKQYQDVYILAVVFNPFIRMRLFNPTALTRNDVVKMAKRVFKRVFDADPESAFSGALLDYIEGVAEFSDDEMMLLDYKTECQKQQEVRYISCNSNIYCTHRYLRTSISSRSGVELTDRTSGFAPDETASSNWRVVFSA